MTKVAIIGSGFLVTELSRSGHDVRHVSVSRGPYNGISEETRRMLEACDCCVLETSPIGYGYFEAGWVAGRGKPVFMIPTSGDVLSSFRVLGVTSVSDLCELKTFISQVISG